MCVSLSVDPQLRNTLLTKKIPLTDNNSSLPQASYENNIMV